MPISLFSSDNQKEGNQLTQQAFECSPNIIFIIDPIEMKLVDANQTALNSLGYSKQELKSKTPQDIDVAFKDDMIKAAFDRIIASKEQHATFPTVYRRKDGTTFEVEAYLRSFSENNCTYILISATNTSVLKKVQDELQFHAALFNSISDAIVATDENFCITSYNKHAQEMFGWNASEAIGKYTHDLMAPIYFNATAEGVRKMIVKDGLWKGEIIIHKNNSETFPAIISIGVLKDNAGKMTGTVSVIRDVTEIKQLERSLKDLNEHLEQRATQKTEELTNVFDRISDGFIAFDADWNFTYVNKKAAEIINRNPKEIIGKNVWREFPDIVGTSLYQKYHLAMLEQRSFRIEEYIEFFQKWFEGLLYPSPEGLSVYFHDITDKKQAEQALLLSQESYRILFEENPVPLWMSDASTYKFININKAAINQYGYSKEEFITMDLEDLKVPEESYPLQTFDNKSREKWKFEKVARHRKKNGEIIYVKVTANRIIHNEKDVWLLAGRDITQELLYEQHLKQSQQQLSLIFDSTDNAMWLMKVEDNNRFRLQLVNNEMTALCHMDKEYLNDRFLDEIFDTTKYQNIITKYVECAQSGTIQKFTSTEQVNNEERIFDFTIIPIKGDEGQVGQLLGICSEITERKKSEKRLIESEEKYKALFERSPLAKWIYDSETLRFLEVNLAAITKYGYSKDEFLTMSLYDIRPKERVGDLVSAYQRSLPDTINTDTIHKKKNGELIKVHVTANALRYENKIARMAIIVDRTEQEKAKDELIATTQQLRELASHLQDIREEERTNIAREIHDELGQQLTALKMDISWLNRKLNTENESINNKIKESLELVDITINSVRKIAAQLRPSMLDDLGLAEAIAWQSRDFSSRTGLAVNCSIDVPVEKISPAISIAIFRIYQEALTNIARHASAMEILCSLQKQDKLLCLTITDNGKGFDLNEQSSRKTLGLLGMKERALMLNGKYKIESKPGEGTKVSVKIPLE